MIAMKLKPAPPNYGVRFRRVDLPGRPTIGARYQRVTDTSLATSLGKNGVMVSTVEHLMAAVYAMGLDNVLIEVDGPEVPIFDGSAGYYFRFLQKAGFKKQNAYRQFLKVERPLMLREGEAYMKVQPSNRFEVSYSIDFPHPLIGAQEFSWSFNRGNFVRDIAPARTFGFLRDVQKLQSLGLAKGGSLDNAMVFDDRGLLNDEGFRYPDECVRHKVLDFIGDLALAGKPLIGRFEVHKAGHKLHNRFLGILLAQDSFCAVVTPQAPSAPAYFPTPPIPAHPVPSFIGGLSLSAGPA
jgi:UDP-3-O-[3-hydroxymyristoyl] N-acetylglucosamine deacetylase